MANTRSTIGETATLDGLINHTLTELEEDGVTSLRSHVFHKNGTIEDVILPNVSAISQYAFSDCTNLDHVSIPSATSIGGYAFQYCKSLNNIDLTNVATISNYVFQYSGIGKIAAPAATSIGTYIRGNRISTADFTVPSSIKGNTFNAAYSFCHLIIRKPTACELSATSAFTNTGIANGIGWIYVPSDLVDSYKAASNWSTYANQIVAIDQYPKRLQNETITDTWDDIIASCNNGTHTTNYNIGDIKYLDVGGTNVPMQIVAFDTDDLASGGKAPITFLCYGQFESMSMNKTDTTEGGWKDCYLRGFLRNTIFNQIESSVKNAIKPVTKTYVDYVNNSATTASITDTIWIPSTREVTGNTSSYENSGCDYSSFFTNDASRIKKSGIGVAGSASGWWLRSAFTSTYFRNVSNSGTAGNNNNPSNSSGVVFGFCI